MTAGSDTDRLRNAIDHTLLKADATPDAIDALCREARKHRFAAVCVAPPFIERAVDALQGTDVGVATVVGFPLGTTLPDVKAYETRRAIELGATEIDVVVRIGALKSGDDDLFRSDLMTVVDASSGRPVKAILETANLDDAEIRRGAELAVEAGCAYLKTSTGFGGRGATVRDVEILVEVAAGRAQVKASGGIRTRRDALAMLDAGATRLGTSSGVALIAD